MCLPTYRTRTIVSSFPWNRRSVPYVARTQTNLKKCILISIAVKERIKGLCCLVGQDIVHFEIRIFHTSLYCYCNFPLLICPSSPCGKVNTWSQPLCWEFCTKPTLNNLLVAVFIALNLLCEHACILLQFTVAQPSFTKTFSVWPRHIFLLHSKGTFSISWAADDWACTIEGQWENESLLILSGQSSRVRHESPSKFINHPYSSKREVREQLCGHHANAGSTFMSR